MEGASSIKSGENAATSKARQIVGDVGKREGIFLRDGVESPVVDGPADLSAVLFWNGDERERPRQVSFFYHPLF